MEGLASEEEKFELDVLQNREPWCSLVSQSMVTMDLNAEMSH